MADGSVVFSTELDTGGLQSDLKGVEKGVKSWASSLTQAFSLTAITAALGKLVKVGTDYNIAMENYATNFGVMTIFNAVAETYFEALEEKYS